LLNELKIDALLDKVDSRYGLALAGARRARQINEYAATLGLSDSLGIPGRHDRGWLPKRPGGGRRREWHPRGWG
jgi:DNA-directed RNA polymerase omega subunit